MALDIVIPDKYPDPPGVWAGGTCGNVLTILAFLGWASRPISRLNTDSSAEWIRQDLQAFGVDTSYVELEPTGSTPVIVERLSEDGNGFPQHTYELTCPNCNTWLPRYKPVLASRVDEIKKDLPLPSVFFFDRASRGAIMLAEHCKDHGALVIFEPSGRGDRKLFREAVGVADIVKYADNRLSDLDEIFSETELPLAIETKGSKGVRYRRTAETDWENIPAYPIEGVRDTAGAGDWCTAGLIYQLMASGEDIPNLLSDHYLIEEALRFGQSLAAINCLFVGARGAMYWLDRESVLCLSMDLLSGIEPEDAFRSAPPVSTSAHRTEVCPACAD